MAKRTLFGRLRKIVENIVNPSAPVEKPPSRPGATAPGRQPEPTPKPQPSFFDRLRDAVVGKPAPAPKPEPEAERRERDKRFAPEPISPPEKEREPRDFLGGRIRYVGFDDRENYEKTSRRPGKYVTLSSAFRNARKIPVPVIIFRRRLRPDDEFAGLYELIVGDSP